MHTNCGYFSFACRSAALAFLIAGAATLLHAQAPTAQPVPHTQFFLSSSAVPNFTAEAGSSSSSSASSSTDDMTEQHFDLKAANPDSMQPPPRRRYGRPNYSDSHTNPDGSSKFAFMAGAGASVPVGNTHKYDTPNYAFQVGVGRNWSQSVGVMLQFDYDHMGLQGSTITNQENLYNYYCSPADQAAGNCSQITGLDGNAHIWSFTLDPTFTLKTEGTMGAYAVVGGGFYHKVTNFTVPAVGTYCDYYYGCYQYQANQVIDHYTSNALGVNGGIGLTWKFSHFSNQRFYAEGRYVVVFNPQRYGVTAFSSNSVLNAYGGSNFFPQNSNRTTYIPVTFGIRF